MNGLKTSTFSGLSWPLRGHTGDENALEFDLAAAKKTYAKVKEELCGAQITSPYDLYSVERDKKLKTPARQFLCQLTSIQAAPDVPYPWTNQKKQLTLKFDQTGIYGDDNQCMFGDMGSIYIYIEPSGRCVATSECY